MLAPALPPPKADGNNAYTHPANVHTTSSNSFKDALNQSEVFEPQNGHASDVAMDLRKDTPEYSDAVTGKTCMTYSNYKLDNGVPDKKETESGDRAGDADSKVEFESNKRKVQWNDNHGKELVQVHEFETSDTDESEDDEEDGESQACTCAIQ